MVPHTEAMLKVEFPFTVPTPLHDRLMSRFDHSVGEVLSPDPAPRAPVEDHSTVDLVV